ncbi:MAG: hypothetical protein BGP11_18545 [Rhodobacterales bacterium 65-51]|nr:DUF6525 family protein [uncultured Gemmobacter sp.]OJY35988.1 MAG: hypothetical protein BGP11_18545 [Rhodobacterales bacterium 65-51]
MRRNLATRLRRRPQKGAPMAVYDGLPPPLRRWLAGALLPWSAASALRLWRRTLAETGSEAAALDRLAIAEARLVARDAARIWGAGHPMAGGAVQPVAG